jgi:hypothetical protein
VATKIGTSEKRRRTRTTAVCRERAAKVRAAARFREDYPASEVPFRVLPVDRRAVRAAQAGVIRSGDAAESARAECLDSAAAESVALPERVACPVVSTTARVFLT